MSRKALLIPFNSQRELYIQDRSNYKPPPWGFFGGTIEAGETPVAAMIREAKEELDLDIAAEDLLSLGDLPTVYDGEAIERNFFLLQTNQPTFTVLEGAGGKWVSFLNATHYMKPADKLDEIEQLITSYGL